jgi:hypothetical protein
MYSTTQRYTEILCQFSLYSKLSPSLPTLISKAVSQLKARMPTTFSVCVLIHLHAYFDGNETVRLLLLTVRIISLHNHKLRIALKD